MILKRQTGSMDSFHASCEGLKGPHFIHLLHLFTLQISHNPHTGLQPNRRGAWFIHENNSHQSARTRTIAKLKKMFCFFRPISCFFRLISGIFRPSFSYDCDWRCFWKIVARVCHKTGPVHINIKRYSSSARHRKIWTTQCVTPMPLLRKGPRHVSPGFWVAFHHRLFTQNYIIKGSWEAILPSYGQIEFWDLKWWRVVRHLTIHNKRIRIYGIDLDEGWYITSQYIT